MWKQNLGTQCGSKSSSEQISWREVQKYSQMEEAPGEVAVHPFQAWLLHPPRAAAGESVKMARRLPSAFRAELACVAVLQQPVFIIKRKKGWRIKFQESQLGAWGKRVLPTAYNFALSCFLAIPKRSVKNHTHYNCFDLKYCRRIFFNANRVSLNGTKHLHRVKAPIQAIKWCIESQLNDRAAQHCIEGWLALLEGQCGKEQ